MLAHDIWSTPSSPRPVTTAAWIVDRALENVNGPPYPVMAVVATIEPGDEAAVGAECWRTPPGRCRGVPYARALIDPPGTVTTLRDGVGRQVSGLNFASQDHLSLSRHLEVVEVAVRAARSRRPQRGLLGRAGGSLRTGPVAGTCERRSSSPRICHGCRTGAAALAPQAAPVSGSLLVRPTMERTDGSAGRSASDRDPEARIAERDRHRSFKSPLQTCG